MYGGVELGSDSFRPLPGPRDAEVRQDRPTVAPFVLKDEFARRTRRSGRRSWQCGGTSGKLDGRGARTG
jgi:hypothetical protein